MNYRALFITAILLVVLIFTGVYHFFIGPSKFKTGVNERLGGVLVEVEEGMGTRQIARLLKQRGVISSASLFSATVSVLGDSKNIVAGYYLFKEPLGVIEAETRLREGEFGLEQIKLTFPEGFTVEQIAERLEAASPVFDKARFMSLASTSEGYLFPDTYFFLPTDDEAGIIKRMQDNFANRTKSIAATSSESLEDIIIVASIIEKEVQNPEDMKLVSGILWDRMEAGMPLQVDATLNYERGLASHELSIADLEEDSPYNTYTNKGLPPTPINNPGLNAISAAVNPTPSPYVYFLTD